MNIDPNILIAAKIIYDECNKHNYCDECDKPICCNECQLYAICYNYAPHNWLIPDPPPEPTKRPRIEWLRMLPDKEMMMAIVEKNVLLSCKDCDICPNCSPCTGNECNVVHMDWWYEVVTLKQFRKDVGLE